ncbi:hypothetical protein BpHYR1_007517 [Brachionus plicatilis]|uniref:RNA-directed DNA polymerase from mobile element jockey-like n=1 Tax=Brachionus plicatilis TaxID=10195 RepID=A0A3M7PMH1_BRAPC|nr:hypothetical protein BpHYR1_007517 [Brachionus plicatilis]
MKISVEKSCSMIFTKNNKESSNRKLKRNKVPRLEVIQNSAVRSILKLRYDTPSNILHHEAYNKLNLLTVSNRLFELSERYVWAGLRHSVPLTFRLVEEYNKGFESRYIEYPTPLVWLRKDKISLRRIVLLQIIISTKYESTIKS